MTNIFVFFFQAEDGIRDLTVTGVQTCALPIYRLFLLDSANSRGLNAAVFAPVDGSLRSVARSTDNRRRESAYDHGTRTRSEERRVGKECRCRWSAYH